MARPPGKAAQRASLTDLGRRYRTDKARSHNYTKHYERHLKHLRSREFTMLEIGIGGANKPGRGGNSLRMWKHFFPKATIVGLDIADKSFVEEPRIRTYRGDQVDKQLLSQIAAEAADGLEVIIDDGSHQNDHVIQTFNHLFPLLNTGGIYAIEDTQTSYWPEYGGSTDLNSRSTMMALVKDLLDGLNYEEFLDESYEPTYADRNIVAVHAYHNLVVIEKGRNEEGSNKRRTLRHRYADEHDHSLSQSAG